MDKKNKRGKVPFGLYIFHYIKRLLKRVEEVTNISEKCAKINKFPSFCAVKTFSRMSYFLNK